MYRIRILFFSIRILISLRPLGPRVSAETLLPDAAAAPRARLSAGAARGPWQHPTMVHNIWFGVYVVYRTVHGCSRTEAARSHCSGLYLEYLGPTLPDLLQCCGDVARWNLCLNLSKLDLSASDNFSPIFRTAPSLPPPLPPDTRTRPGQEMLWFNPACISLLEPARVGGQYCAL